MSRTQIGLALGAALAALTAHEFASLRASQLGYLFDNPSPASHGLQGFQDWRQHEDHSPVIINETPDP